MSEQEVKKFEIGMKDGAFVAKVDSDQDGIPVIDAKVNINEAIQEAFQRQDAVEGVKVLDFSFTGTMLVLKLDTDKDGEKVLELNINLMEGLDETGILK